MAIYDTADIDSAIETIVDGCFYSNGQVNKKFYYIRIFLTFKSKLSFTLFKHRYSLNKVFIQENIYEDVRSRLEKRFAKLRVGNHMDKCNDIGPLLNPNDISNFREISKNQVTESGVQVLAFNRIFYDLYYLNKLFKLFKVSEFKSCLQENANALIAPTIFTNVPLNSQLNLNEVIV